MKFHLKSVVIALPIVALAACTAPEEDMNAAEAVDPMAGEVGQQETSEGAFEVCDESGNRYPSEDAAKAEGLEEAQYGATYCQYFD